MSLQVFLQAHFTGTEQFLSSPSLHQAKPSSIKAENNEGDIVDLLGRCAWLGLLSEVLPRALLADLKLSRMLLGSSGGEQFLLVLTDESIQQAEDFLRRAAAEIAALSGDTLGLVWASTENLGSWPVVRQRLDEQLVIRRATPLAANGSGEMFAPFATNTHRVDTAYFQQFGQGLPSAITVGWSPDTPAHLTFDSGVHAWPLKDQMSPDEDSIPFPRRFAHYSEDAQTSASDLAPLTQLASFAEGAPRWGILRGDVDNFEQRLRSLASIEDHIHLSLLYKEFFAGELTLLCTLPEFWRKVSILYRGGDDFAVYGAWDALVALARELQRVFEKFVEQNLSTSAGLEGKTISMALAINASADDTPTSVFEAATTQLRNTKATEIGTVCLFGRTLEWKRVVEAEEVKSSLVRLVRDFGYSPEYIHDLASIYREAYAVQASRRAKTVRINKPWRIYMRLSRVIPASRNKEMNQIRSSLITNLLGKKTANLKLRPSARVGLEWARLSAGQ